MVDEAERLLGFDLCLRGLSFDQQESRFGSQPDKRVFFNLRCLLEAEPRGAWVLTVSSQEVGALQIGRWMRMTMEWTGVGDRLLDIRPSPLNISGVEKVLISVDHSLGNLGDRSELTWFSVGDDRILGPIPWPRR